MTCKQLVISGATSRDQRIRAIKALRSITNCGLKEGKDIVDAMQTGEIFRIKVSTQMQEADAHHELMSHIADLRLCGHTVVVNGNHELYADQLKEIATAATLSGDYYVAKVILDLLEKNF